MQSPILEFESTSFAVSDGEDEATNPGVYGQSLALWLAARLQIAEADVIAEDFGWCIPVADAPHRLYVACASEDHRKDRWCVFVFAEGGLLARLFGQDRRAQEVKSVFQRIRELLAAQPEVHALVEREA